MLAMSNLALPGSVVLNNLGMFPAEIALQHLISVAEAATAFSRSHPPPPSFAHSLCLLYACILQRHLGSSIYRVPGIGDGLQTDGSPGDTKCA